MSLSVGFDYTSPLRAVQQHKGGGGKECDTQAVVKIMVAGGILK